MPSRNWPPSIANGSIQNWPSAKAPCWRRQEIGVGVRAGGDRLSVRGRGEAARTGHLRGPVGQERFSHDRAADCPRGYARSRTALPSTRGRRRRLTWARNSMSRPRTTDTARSASLRGRSKCSWPTGANTAAWARASPSKSSRACPRSSPASSRATARRPSSSPRSSRPPATITPTLRKGTRHIRVLRGRPKPDSGPVEVLLDGKGQSRPIRPRSRSSSTTTLRE